MKQPFQFLYNSSSNLAQSSERHGKELPGPVVYRQTVLGRAFEFVVAVVPPPTTANSQSTAQQNLSVDPMQPTQHQDILTSSNSKAVELAAASAAEQAVSASDTLASMGEQT